ncbi:MAG: DUF2887 domain-containing protein [Synechococcales bacterium]|nr:DUF2887 domain-containing protein [Synechococcales bacterium]
MRSPPYRALLNSGQVHRIYLDELGPIETLPLGLATLKLTIARTSETVEQAKRLIERAQQELPTDAARQGIIELVSSIVTYRFTTLSRQEVNAMLGISLEKTRVYQEAKEEGREEGLQEGREKGLQEGLQEGLQQQRSLILKQLVRRVGELPPELRQQVQGLSSPTLEALGEVLLDFTQVEELRVWLEQI